MVKKIKGSFLFKITADDGTVHEWLIDLKSGNGSVTKGSGKKNIKCDPPSLHYFKLQSKMNQ